MRSGEGMGCYRLRLTLYTKPSPAPSLLSLYCLARAPLLRVYATHLLYLWVPCASLRSIIFVSCFWFYSYVFIFLSFCRFYRVFGRYILSLELCSCPSAIFLPSRPRTLLVLDWQPRIILLGMVEARSVTCNLNNTQTYTHSLRESKVQALVEDTWSFRERELVVWTKR